MRRFWKSVIQPIVKELNPKVIVEIGAAEGKNSARIIDYCLKNKSTCHIVDPVEPIVLKELAEKLSKVGKFHQGLSLNVLPEIKGDLYLVDGDHNWYTVYNELKLIFDKNTLNPTIFFHDIAWPYARRDMYYDPKNIPAMFCKPFDIEKGIDLNTNELVLSSGLNRGLANSIEYGGEQNGVLTAIENFIENNNLHLTHNFYQLPILNGLGLLIPKIKLVGNLNELVNSIFNLSSHLLEILQVTEIERIKHMRNYIQLIEDEEKVALKKNV